MKVSTVKQILTEALLIVMSNETVNEQIAGQILAYKTELEIYYPDDTKQISLPETICNLLAIANRLK